jgi:hypothetical protein
VRGTNEAKGRQLAVACMITLLQRRALETEDWLRYHPLVRGLCSDYQCWRGRGEAPPDPLAALPALCRRCAAARFAGDLEAEARIQADIAQFVRQLAEHAPARAAWAPGFDDTPIFKTAVLKPYLGPREKGVVFIAFENQWIKVLRAPDLHEFARRYTLVVAPSSSPHNLVNYVFPALYPGPVFTLISNPRDPAVLRRVAPNLVVVPLYASSWVNPDLFAPLPHGERPYDLVMVANFAKVKRHQAFFAALREMPRPLRILLIGHEQYGRTAATIRAMARWYGVADRFELRTNQSHAEVAAAFCQSKASVVLSRREGSCVVVAESLFADTPAALLEGAEIGSRVFLNEQTGRFLRDNALACELTAFVAEAARYQPRAWAQEHISCIQSSRLLNEQLRAHALAAGQEWSEDIAPMHWCPDPQLVRAEDRRRLAPEHDEIRQRFGLELR